MNKLQIRRSIKNHYDNYPKYFKQFSKQLILERKECELKDNTCKGKLTVAHIDQNPNNNNINNLKVLCTSHHIRLDQPFHLFSMQTITKTDNSFLNKKIELRLKAINNINKSEINILEAYSGDGKIWGGVIRQTDKKLNILKIEIKNDKKGVYLKGKNEKFIPLFDFSNYDIIDFDAYGVPYNQLEVVFLKNFKGIVIVTFIQTGMGNLHDGFLLKLGFSKKMIEKCRTIFTKNGLQKMMDYLSCYKIKEIEGFFIERKSYFFFTIM